MRRKLNLALPTYDERLDSICNAALLTRHFQ
jgi:hypothetical protein